MSEFNANSTTYDVLEGIDLAGSRAVITGASAGLGVELFFTFPRFHLSNPHFPPSVCPFGCGVNGGGFSCHPPFRLPRWLLG